MVALQEDSRKGFKHFQPRFPPESDPSLTRASAINVAFVFQKVSAKPGPALVPAVKQTVQQQQQHERVPERAAEPAGVCLP